MATGIAVARANASIDATVALGTWIKLHLGDPGSAGTSNAASNTTRQQATFGAATAGVAATTVALTWTSVAATETYSHFSMWTASTAGTFLWSGTVTGGSVTAGNNFTAAIANLTLTETGAA